MEDTNDASTLVQIVRPKAFNGIFNAQSISRLPTDGDSNRHFVIPTTKAARLRYYASRHKEIGGETQDSTATLKRTTSINGPFDRLKRPKVLQPNAIASASQRALEAQRKHVERLCRPKNISEIAQRKDPILKKGKKPQVGTFAKRDGPATVKRPVEPITSVEEYNAQLEDARQLLYQIKSDYHDLKMSLEM